MQATAPAAASAARDVPVTVTIVSVGGSVTGGWLPGPAGDRAPVARSTR